LNPEENTIEPDTQTPSLSIKEIIKPLNVFEINPKDMDELYTNSGGVKDFMKKCVEYVMENIAKKEEVLKLINLKCYVQVKVIFEYYHDKPYEPTFKTLKRPFYVDKLIQRSNLVQSVDELKSVIERQSNDILLMIDKFENQGSNWVIVRPLDFKLRLVRYTIIYSES
jgi:hypothetical protein